MEFLDGLLALFDSCFGFLEVATLLLIGAAVYLGNKTYRRTVGHVHKKPTWTPFIVLLALAIFFTALLAYKYLKR